MRINKILRDLKKEVNSPCIENFPRYIELGYSIFKNGFNQRSEEDRRWAFLLWAYEDKVNEIHKDIREDDYINKLFSKPYEIYLENGKTVVMHEYHYRFFTNNIESFRNWGFEDLEKSPLSYLEWFYSSGLKATHYASVTKLNQLWMGYQNNNEISILDMPIYLEISYLKNGFSFVNKSSEEDRRWAFLLWAYEDKVNEIHKDIREDDYINKLFSKPYEIYLENGKTVVMHEYHYRFFTNNIESFRNWGFEDLEKSPLSYLEWFYTQGLISKLPYAILTKEIFSGIR